MSPDQNLLQLYFCPLDVYILQTTVLQYCICLALFLLESFNVGVKLATWAQNEVHTSSTAMVLWPFLWSWQLLGLPFRHCMVFVCICGYHTIPGFASRDGYPNSAVLYIEILELQDVCASARVWHEWPVSGGSGSCKIPSGLASHTVFWDASDFCRSMHCLHRTGEGLVVSSYLSSSLLSREPLCVCSPGGLCRVQIHIQFHICNFAVCSSTARGFGHHFWDAAIQICAEYCC